VFGQCGASQSHLEKQQVGVGDVFLFFGLYRRTKIVAGNFDFAKNSQNEHVIWGWLQVDKIIRVENDTLSSFPWCREHPHIVYTKRNNNVIYTASKSLTISGADSSVAGSGVFSEFNPRLKLTAEESQCPSVWRLPVWFSPQNGGSLSYHTVPNRWHRCKKYRDKVLLESVGRGQEFVIDIGDDIIAKEWLFEILTISQHVQF
jgi:hypothetical protein